MNYTDNINALSRTKVDLIKLRMPFCRHSYGVAPCNANGVVKCYNTFPTCQSRADFDSIGKTYKFVNEALPISVINQIDLALPYIADNGINDLATEIKEDDTIVKRLKVKFFDETDNEVGVDPYFDERKPAGEFWKKFIQRNKNYRGKTIEHWQGFDGLSEDQYQLKFAGVLDNFEYNRSAQLEAVDFLKELSKIDYPLKVDLRCKNDVPKVHNANSQTGMLALEAYQDDYCQRTEFINISGNVNLSAQTTGIGNLDPGYYYFRIVIYDSQNRPIALGSFTYFLIAPNNQILFDWGLNPPSAYGSYYRIFYGTAQDGPFEQYVQLTDYPLYYLYDLVVMQSGTLPTEAERFYQLTGTDPSDINDWTQLTAPNFTIAIEGSQIDDLPASGYLRIDKEIIYYSSFYLQAGTYYLSGVRRTQFNTEGDWHYQYTVFFVLYHISTPKNPFAAMRDLLNLAGIEDNYIADTFTSYGAEWGSSATNPSVTLRPILKDIKFSQIYFDLVRITNCMSWVNEDGKIDILNWDYDLGLQSITHDDIIENSVAVDYNDASRMTRWIIYWMRTDPEAGIDEAKAFSRANVEVDADAESANEYGDIKEDVQFCVWFNEDSGDEDTISNYLNGLLAKRLTRTRDAQEIVTLELELKDDAIVTGNVIKLSTSYVQDIYGQPYNEVKFRVMKKELTGPNKFKLKLLRKF